MKNLSYIFVVLFICISKLISFNWIVGSVHSVFSCSTMFAPVIGKYFGFSWIVLYCLCGKSLTLASFFYSCLHRMPLVFAALSYQQRHWTTSFLVPALCMALFVTHHIGMYAWCYSLYWFIPMALYFVPDSIVSRAVTSAFTAHAVGSVIWLYGGHIAADVWIMLLPVVICERLLMALGIIVSDVVVARLLKYNVFVSYLGSKRQYLQRLGLV